MDGIFKTDGNNAFEYGAIEVSSCFRGSADTKYICDSQKLTKVLRDMLYRLHELVDHNPAIVASLQVIGVINAGYSLQLIRMHNPKGHICILRREERQEIPANLSGFNNLCLLLMTILQMKVCV